MKASLSTKFHNQSLLAPFSITKRLCFLLGLHRIVKSSITEHEWEDARLLESILGTGIVLDWGRIVTSSLVAC